MTAVAMGFQKASKMQIQLDVSLGQPEFHFDSAPLPIMQHDDHTPHSQRTWRENARSLQCHSGEQIFKPIKSCMYGHAAVHYSVF